MMYEPIASTSSELDAGHDQAINNAGYVVGYTGTQGSTWRAAIWQPNGIGGGTITDLNTTFASELAGTGFTLNCAAPSTTMATLPAGAPTRRATPIRRS